MKGSKSGKERTGETSFSNCFTKSDLQDFLIVPSSWNRETGIGPSGSERILSIVTSSLLLAKIRAKNNFWIYMAGYNFARFTLKGCLSVHMFKCFQFGLGNRAIESALLTNFLYIFSPSLTAESKES